MGVVASSLHFVSAAPSSSHSASAPVWGPSHGRQFSTNFSNMSPSHGLQFFINSSSVGPSHRVQSFKNRLLQCGSPFGSQVLPANLLQRGLLSPWSHRSWQEPAPARTSHRVTACFRHRPAPAWALHGLQVEICSTVDLHGLQGTACLTRVCSRGCRGISGAWSTSSPSSFTDLGVCRVVCLPSSQFSPS